MNVRLGEAMKIFKHLAEQTLWEKGCDNGGGSVANKRTICGWLGNSKQFKRSRVAAPFLELLILFSASVPKRGSQLTAIQRPIRIIGENQRGQSINSGLHVQDNARDSQDKIQVPNFCGWI